MSVDPHPGASDVPATRERLPRAFGKFALKRRLARGGMADVYLASLSGAEGFEKELVVKLIRPELAADEAFVRRFVDEAKTCVRLTHPNIVSIFELGVETGVLYLAMDLVRGATLAEVLQEGGPLKPDEGAYVALEVARALHHAHRRGVIHRDVTPGNVMLDDEGAVKLLDFGIAAPAGGLEVEVFGTPGHMPPEQIEGRALTGAADLFALGTVMLEGWTGRPPFRRADARASKTALHDAPPLPSTAHADLAPLDDVVQTMLSLDAKNRPQHADEIARVLRAYLRERNVDLDEVARALSQRVRRAVVAREDREAGRVTAAPAMPKAMRPTPLGDASRTFATRGSIDTWSGGETRKLDAEDTQEDAPPSLPSPPSMGAGTRRIEESPSAPSEPRSSSSRRWTVGVVVVAGLAGAAYVATKMGGGTPVQPPLTTNTSTSTSLATSAAASNTATVVASTTNTSTATSATNAGTASATVVASTSTTATVAATAAKLIVTSSPPSSVELDGRALGPTPVSTTAALGDHRLVLRPKGLGESFERRVTLGATWGMDVHGDFNDEPQITLRRIPTGSK